MYGNIKLLAEKIGKNNIKTHNEYKNVNIRIKEIFLKEKII